MKSVGGWPGTGGARAAQFDDLEPVIEKVRSEGINAVAVCLLHSYAYPEHELEAREILTAALPGVSISLSHEIAREWREYERASSAVMNAYVAPVVERYLSSLQEQLPGLNMQATVHIMQSSGGVTTAESARKNPVFTLLSGPVGARLPARLCESPVDRTCCASTWAALR